jgi:hypothetical protein
VDSAVISAVRGKKSNRTELSAPHSSMFLWYDTTSDLVGGRAYLCRLRAARCASEVLHLTATEFPVLRASQTRGVPLNAA